MAAFSRSCMKADHGFNTVLHQLLLAVSIAGFSVLLLLVSYIIVAEKISTSGT